MLNISSDVLQAKKKDAAAQRNFRHFIGFLMHSFRFLIVCQSIDHKCLSQDNQIEIALKQVVRKYEQIKKILPNNADLLDALKSDSSMILWFRHNDGKGCYLNDFNLSRKFA